MKLMAYVQPMFLFTPLEVMQMGGGRGVQQTSPADTSTSFTDACLREAPAEQLRGRRGTVYAKPLDAFCPPSPELYPPPLFGNDRLAQRPAPWSNGTVSPSNAVQRLSCGQTVKQCWPLRKGEGGRPPVHYLCGSPGTPVCLCVSWSVGCLPHIFSLCCSPCAACSVMQSGRHIDAEPGHHAQPDCAKDTLAGKTVRGLQYPNQRTSVSRVPSRRTFNATIGGQGVRGDCARKGLVFTCGEMHISSKAGLCWSVAPRQPSHGTSRVSHTWCVCLVCVSSCFVDPAPRRMPRCGQWPQPSQSANCPQNLRCTRTQPPLREALALSHVPFCTRTCPSTAVSVYRNGRSRTTHLHPVFLCLAPLSVAGPRGLLRRPTPWFVCRYVLRLVGTCREAEVVQVLNHGTDGGDG